MNEQDYTAQRAAILSELRAIEETGLTDKGDTLAKELSWEAVIGYELRRAARAERNIELQRQIRDLRAERHRTQEKEALIKHDICLQLDRLLGELLPVLSRTLEGQTLIDAVLMRRDFYATRELQAAE